MLVINYLKQGRLLDQKINCDLRLLQELRTDVCNIGSPVLSENKVQTSHDGDAPFVRALMQIEEMQEQINREIDLLVDLRKQYDEVIRSVESAKHQLVLIYRYREGKTWSQIGEKLGAGKSTVKRWHLEAIQMVKMPDEPIFCKSIL